MVLPSSYRLPHTTSLKLVNLVSISVLSDLLVCALPGRHVLMQQITGL